MLTSVLLPAPFGPDDRHDLAVAHRRARRPTPRGRRRRRSRGAGPQAAWALAEVDLDDARVAHDLARAAGGDHLALVQDHDAVATARAPRASGARRRGWSTPRARISRIRRMALAISAGLSPDSTSSSRITRGRPASARASSRNLRSCRFSSSGSAVARRPSPVKSSQSRASARASAGAHGARRRRSRRARRCRARVRWRERPRDLIGARDAEPGDRVRRPARERRVAERDPPAVGRVVAADHVDQRGLARAVRARRARRSRPAPTAEAHAAQRLDAAERLPHARGTRAAPARRRGRGAGRPSRRPPVAPRPTRGRRRPRRPRASRAQRRAGTTPSGRSRIDQDQHERDHRAPEDRLLAAGEGVERGGDDRGADRGTQPVARAAEHAHEHDVERHGDRERLAHRDVAHVHRVDAAGHAGDRRPRARRPTSL